MRRLSLIVVTGAATIAACSGGSGGGPGARPERACPLFERLAATAAIVEEVDPADPDRAQQALDTAVTEMVATLDDLRGVVPDDLGDELDRLTAAASQYRFADGFEARVALDDYAAGICGEAPSTTAPSSG